MGSTFVRDFQENGGKRKRVFCLFIGLIVCLFWSRVINKPHPQMSCKFGEVLLLTSLSFVRLFLLSLGGRSLPLARCFRHFQLLFKSLTCTAKKASFRRETNFFLIISRARAFLEERFSPMQQLISFKIFHSEFFRTNNAQAPSLFYVTSRRTVEVDGMKQFLATVPFFSPNTF